MRRLIITVLALCLIPATAAFAAPANDNFTDATLIEAIPYTDATTNEGATTETYEPRPCGAIGATIWYRFSPADPGTLIADTFGSAIDTVLAVYSGTGPFNLTRIGCNDDSDGDQSKVAFRVTAGRTYYIQVGGYGGAQGPTVVSVGYAGSIAGKVTGEEDQTLPDICVDAFDPSRRLQGTGYTDQSGAYVIEGLASGEYRVRFTDCGSYGDDAMSRLYATEWYSDKVSFPAADPVPVAKGQETGGIDATLNLRPRPDLAITSMTFEDTKLRTGAGELPAGTGTSKRITVEVTNVGGIAPRWSILTVDACPKTSGSCRQIGEVRITLKPGATVNKTFTWAAADMVGDVTVSALANANEDADWNNNVWTEEQFVHIGGLGVGIGPECTRLPLIFLPLFCQP